MKNNEKIKSKTKNNKKVNIIETTKNKITCFQNMINKTVIAIQNYKNYDILNPGEINICVKNLEDIYSDLLKINSLIEHNIEIDEIINKLQNINDELSNIFRAFGTQDINDLLMVCFGANYLETQITDENVDKWNIIKRFVHPIGYKILNWKNEQKKMGDSYLAKNRIVEDFAIVEVSKTFDCYDLSRTSNNFQTKVYGIKISFQNILQKKTLIMTGIVDDILLKCFNDNFVNEKIKSLAINIPNDCIFLEEDFKKFVESLTLKELLIYSDEELYNKFIGYNNQSALIKQKPISQVVKEFLNSQLYQQRTTLIQLLLKHNNPEYQYLAYLLYDLLSNDSNGNIDTLEQTMLYDSFPWTIKKYFRDAMKSTIQYTNNLSNFDQNKIPMEQQICLMKVSENVKEKAMIKLKEVKSKSDDSGSKARQFLEGLLKIPFGVYKKENILSAFKQIHDDFKGNYLKLKDYVDEIPEKQNYNILEIKQYNKILEDKYVDYFNSKYIDQIIEVYANGKRENLISNICFINNIIKINKLNYHRIRHSGKKRKLMKEEIKEFIKYSKNDTLVIDTLYKNIKNVNFENLSIVIKNGVNDINEKEKIIYNGINNVNEILEQSVHGHKNAKRQIERIVGQWITGKQSGYCFGFEGPPGLGKTSLAKRGLSKCLQDENGESRPFSFIAIGGSSNGSVLDGHNYTYVGSTWGKIVDILMDSKCMNPIIFIDELDKVSKTENGKEIIGILTHLVDTTQNETFQDKYFSGIDLDLSNVLFIFSYNDPALIDRILLDRIHRIKFDSLTLEDKITITKKYILPEVYEKMNLDNDIIEFNEDIIKFVIDYYTYESGVRKLKEIIFEIISEINLEILNSENIVFPIKVTEEEIKNKYLKERNEIRFVKIPDESSIGVINGLWANSYGKGGVIPIEVSFFPTTSFLELKLTGLQGDVMKESMNVAKTLAWKLTSDKKQKELVKKFETCKMQGLHIHCPEGATPKDGPSAGGAITVALYSILNNKKIKNTIAMTGEINIQGKITAIGGLELKILGGIRAGVKEFLYPSQNKKDFDKFMERYGENKIINNIKFHEVSNINEVLKLVF
jgi:ATP-dependent Lon protease